jgi:methylated-DNA-[protein]-cysteine S-methyltransferase
MKLALEKLPSPIGTVLLVSNGDAILALDYAGYEDRMMGFLNRRFADLKLAAPDRPSRFAEAVQAYFDGDLTGIDTLPIDPGGTPFQQTMWAELRKVPAGTTTTYGALAARLGKASASRAVGMANGRNPIAIILPCHRVIGADGSLTGYAGGLERKRWLLVFEAGTAH